MSTLCRSEPSPHALKAPTAKSCYIHQIPTPDYNNNIVKIYFKNYHVYFIKSSYVAYTLWSLVNKSFGCKCHCLLLDVTSGKSDNSCGVLVWCHIPILKFFWLPVSKKTNTSYLKNAQQHQQFLYTLIIHAPQLFMLHVQFVVCVYFTVKNLYSFTSLQ
jgi:hypothetical protein